MWAKAKLRVAVGMVAVSWLALVAVASPPHAIAALAADVSAGYVPLSPVRVYDSRDFGDSGRLSSGQARSVDVAAAIPTLPAGAVAISYNVTVTGTALTGWLAVAPGGSTSANSSSINWDVAGTTVANGYIVALNGGKLTVLAGGGGSAHFVLDVTGYYVPAPSGAQFVPVAPKRAYDSRSSGSGGALASGASRTVSLAGAGVPAAAVGVAYNLTVADTRGPGYLAVSPPGTSPTGSTLNWTATGQVLSNGSQGAAASRSMVVSAGGGGSAQFIVDVVGYFVPAAQAGGLGTTFTPLAPVRAYDSRSADGPLAVPLARTTSMVTTASGSPTGVPAGAAAVVYNITQTQTVGAGFLAVAPGGGSTAVSTLNWYRTGQTQANGTTVALNPLGQVTTEAGGAGATEYVVDIAGYYR